MQASTQSQNSKWIPLSTLLGLSLLCPISQAQSIDDLSTLTQAELADFSRDLSAASHYKSTTPAEPLGILGFDVGIGYSNTQLSHPEIWQKVDSSASRSDSLSLTRLQVHKGLPFGLDVGASYSLMPNGNAKIFGAELRYAIWEGSVLWPALAVRGSYARTEGIDVLEAEHTGIELTASKGILMFTPYIGVGYVRSHINPKGTRLDSVSVSQEKVFIGSNVNFLGINGVAEIDNTDGRSTFSLRLGIRF
jgi:hypothetical protein